MEFFDINNELTGKGGQTLYDWALKLTQPEALASMKIFGDEGIGVKNPNFAARVGIDINNPRYINPDLYYNTNLPLNKQSNYILQKIIENTDNQKLFDYAMQLGEDLPVGGVRYTGLQLDDIYGLKPNNLGNLDTDEFFKYMNISDELGLDGIVAPQRSGTEIGMNRGIRPESIDQRVAGTNIGGRPQVKSKENISKTFEEIVEGARKAHANLNKPTSIADKAVNFMIKHPSLMKTAKVGGKVMAPVGWIMSGLGAYEGLTGQGAGITPALMGIISGPDAARLMKENAANAAYSSRDKSFNLDTPEEREAYRRTIFNRQYENLE